MPGVCPGGYLSFDLIGTLLCDCEFLCVHSSKDSCGYWKNQVTRRVFYDLPPKLLLVVVSCVQHIHSHLYLPKNSLSKLYFSFFTAQFSKVFTHRPPLLLRWALRALILIPVLYVGTFIWFSGIFRDSFLTEQHNLGKTYINPIYFDIHIVSR